MSRMVIKPENCDVMAGPNTKQLWVYDNELDVFIDPPAAVLDKCDEAGGDWDDKQARLEEMLKDNPKWLQDKEFWYDGDTDI